MSFGPTRVALGTATYQEYYPNILLANHHETDDVFIATMRLLLTDERLAAASKVERNVHCFCCQPIKVEGLAEKNPEQLKEFYTGLNSFSKARYGIYIHVLNGADGERACKEYRNYASEFKGFKLVDDLALYLDKTGTVTVFQNESRRLTQVFCTPAQEIEVMHKAASAMPRIFPWCFKDAHKPTADELAILKSIAEDKPGEFIAACEAAIAAADFRGKKIAGLLDKFCRSDLPSQIERLDRTIRDANSAIENHLQEIREKQRRIEELQMQQMMMRNRHARGEKDDNELLDYLRANQEIQLLKRDGSTLYLAVTSYLDTFDEDMFNTYVVGAKNDSSYIYSKSPWSFELTKKLFLAIWQEQRFRIRTYCSWRINANCAVESNGRDGLPRNPEFTENRIPQPHIYYYDCYSGYRGMLSDAQSRLDYVGAMSIIAQSSHSLNWADSTVVGRFMDDFFRNHKGTKFLEDADGNLYTPAEVIAILKKEAK